MKGGKWFCPKCLKTPPQIIKQPSEAATVEKIKSLGIKITNDTP